VGKADVLEVRIHGVGGATPEELLGVVARSDTIRIAGDELAGFYARRSQRHVQGYSWGRLNAAAWEQPAWILLLPFTLVNVAGWFAPDAPERPWADRVGDALLFLFGLSVTVLYAVWIADISIDLVAVRWVYERFRGIPAVVSEEGLRPMDPYRTGYLWAIAGGTVLALGVLAALRLLVRNSLVRYEATGAGGGPAVRPSFFGTRVAAGQPGLEDPAFWSRVSDARRLLTWHSVAAVLTVLLVTWWFCDATFDANLAPVAFDLPQVFRWLSIVQVTLLALLLIPGVARSVRGGRPPHALGAPVLCGLALLLGHALLYGIGNLINLRVHVGVTPFQLAGPAGAVAIVATLLVIVAATWVLWISADDRCDLLTHPEETPLGQEVDRVTRGVRRRAIRQERLARLVPRVGWFFAPLSVLFVVIVLWRAITPTWLEAEWDTGILHRIGTTVLVLVATSLLAFIIRGFRQPSDRRPFAVMWDVLSFWPRRYHPLGVRPYAERAVPEIEARLHDLLDRPEGEHRRVIVAAHSQGSVLAYAVFLRLAASHSDLLSRVAFVTYGTPLKNLYARFFPRYFSVARIEQLRGQIGSPAPSDDAWKNFYRPTDYVGGTVFTSVNAAHDRLLPDPPEHPRVEEVPAGGTVTDLPSAPFTKLSIHSGYPAEREIRQWIDVRLRTTLGGSAP
jgi:hypothetical protein